jgi:predicted nucleic acid-binding protein
MSGTRLHDPHLGLGLSPFGPSAVGVLDTDFLFEQAAAKIRDWRLTGGFYQAMSVGSLRLFAPMRVADELCWNYGKVARRLHVPPAQLLYTLQSDFIPHIRFVTQNPDDPITDPRAVAVTDRDDLPVVRLALMLAPCHVYSLDKHLRHPGFAPRTKAEMAGLIGAEQTVSILDGGAVATVFTTRLGFAGLAEGARRVASRLDVPTWFVVVAGLLLVFGSSAVVLSSPERRTRARQLAASVGDNLRAAAEEHGRALSILDGKCFPPGPGHDLRRGIARVLALAPKPLLAKEVQTRLAVETNPTLVNFVLERLLVPDAQAGDPVTEIQDRLSTELRSAPELGKVRHALASDPAFVKVDRYRWQLGRRIVLRCGAETQAGGETPTPLQGSVRVEPRRLSK